MLKRFGFLSFIVCIFTLSMCDMGTNKEFQDDESILMEVVNPDSNMLLELTDGVNKSNKPIIVYSRNPKIVNADLVVEKVKVDFETHQSAVENTRLEKLVFYQYDYTIIEPGDKLHTYSMLQEDSDNYSFLKSRDTAACEVATRVYTMDVDSRSLDDSSTATDRSWIWNSTLLCIYSSLDVNKNGYFAEHTYKHQVWRSKYDYNTQKKWWATEWNVSTKVDSGDYRAKALNFVGPWVHQRYLKVTGSDEQLWDWGPTTAIGKWTYGISASLAVGANASGPTANASMGLSQSWTQSDVTITDMTSDYYDVAEWSETFLGPDYTWWPFWRKPCSASHNTFLSYRGALWNTSPTDSMDFKQDCMTAFRWDDNFVIHVTYYIARRNELRFSLTDNFSYPAN